MILMGEFHYLPCLFQSSRNLLPQSQEFWAKMCIPGYSKFQLWALLLIYSFPFSGKTTGPLTGSCWTPFLLCFPLAFMGNLMAILLIPQMHWGNYTGILGDCSGFWRHSPSQDSFSVGWTLLLYQPVIRWGISHFLWCWFLPSTLVFCLMHT